jgi:hypothetical protein
MLLIRFCPYSCRSYGSCYLEGTISDNWIYLQCFCVQDHLEKNGQKEMLLEQKVKWVPVEDFIAIQLEKKKKEKEKKKREEKGKDKPAEEEEEKGDKKRKAVPSPVKASKKGGKTESKDKEEEEIITSPTTISMKKAGVGNVRGNVTGLRRVQTAVRRNSKG